MDSLDYIDPYSRVCLAVPEYANTFVCKYCKSKNIEVAFQVDPEATIDDSPRVDLTLYNITMPELVDLHAKLNTFIGMYQAL